MYGVVTATIRFDVQWHRYIEDALFALPPQKPRHRPLGVRYVLDEMLKIAFFAAHMGLAALDLVANGDPKVFLGAETSSHEECYPGIVVDTSLEAAAASHMYFKSLSASY